MLRRRHGNRSGCHRRDQSRSAESGTRLGQSRRAGQSLQSSARIAEHSKRASVARHYTPSALAPQNEHLPERKVPRHDGQDGANRQIADEAALRSSLHNLIGQKSFGVLRVVAATRGALQRLGHRGFQKAYPFRASSNGRTRPFPFPKSRPLASFWRLAPRTQSPHGLETRKLPTAVSAQFVLRSVGSKVLQDFAGRRVSGRHCHKLDFPPFFTRVAMAQSGAVFKPAAPWGRELSSSRRLYYMDWWAASRIYFSIWTSVFKNKKPRKMFCPRFGGCSAPSVKWHSGFRNRLRGSCHLSSRAFPKHNGPYSRASPISRVLPWREPRRSSPMFSAAPRGP